MRQLRILRANDYLAKPFYPEELIARIRERFSSKLSDRVEEETYSFGNSVFNYSTNEIRTANSKVLITSRQAELLRLLALNLNIAVERDKLLESVKNDPTVKIESLIPDILQLILFT